MTGLSALLLPALCVAVMWTVLRSLRGTTSLARGTETHWCVAGLLAMVLLGVLLVDANDLFSLTERLARLDVGAGASGAAAASPGTNGINFSWGFLITPLAAWWVIGCSALLCVVGWTAHRNWGALPCGWLGLALGLTTCGAVFAENLMTLFLLIALQGTSGGLWLAWQARSADAVVGVRRWMVTVLLSDTLGLIGVYLAGLSCRTFELAALGDPEFVRRCWEERPALCGLAGTCLFLGLLGRCTLFPFCKGSQHVAEFRGPANGLILSVCSWPAMLWFFLRVQPLLSVAPETVSVAQGLSLVGAVIGAFLAAAQSDVRRTTALLATSQFGLLMSAAIISEVCSPLEWSLAIGTIAVAAMTVFLACDSPVKQIGWQTCLLGTAWLVMAGGCFSPTFWLAGQAVERFQTQEITLLQADETQDALAVSAIPRPLPATTWTAAWCAWSFFAAFAAWRGGRGPACAGRNEAGAMSRDQSQPAAVPHSVSPSLALSFLLLVTLLAGMSGSGWLALRELGTVISPGHWPLGAALAASLAGGVFSAWVCRDPELTDQRWQQLGSWTRLAQREFYLDEICWMCWELPVRGAAQLIRFFEWSLINPAGRWLGVWMARSIVAAGDELRSEPASFYAGAVLLTVATWLVTWLALAG